MLTYGQDSAPVSTGAAPTDEATFAYPNSPSMAVPQQPDPNATLLTGGHIPATPTNAQKAPGDKGDQDTGPRQPIIDRTPDGGGDPPSSYDTHLGTLFDGPMMDASVLDQHELKEQLTSARDALKGVLTEYQPGNFATQEMISVVSEYSRSPRSDAAVQQEYETTRASLQRKWGDQYNTMVAGAQRVLNEVCRRVPGMADTLADSGVLNNERFIIHMANLAQKRHGKTMLTR